MKVRMIVDSTADLSAGLREKLMIVPLSLRFGDREYAQGVDLTNEQFYAMLPDCKELPSTSQASPAAFEEKYREVVEAGDTAVVVTVSSRLSGTFQSAIIASEDFEGKIFVVDSRSVAIGTGILVEEGLKLIEQGLSAEEVFSQLIAMRDKIQVCAVLDTLEYLKKGGRISSAAAIAGGLLSIKPIICLKDGKLEMTGKARGAKQAAASLLTAMDTLGVDESKAMLLGYTGQTRGPLEKFIADNTARFGENPPAAIVGSVIGAHAGPNAMAVAFFSK